MSMTRPSARVHADTAGQVHATGDGLCVGFDSGDNVSQQYKNPGTFTGGTILGVAVDVSDEAYLDLEKGRHAPSR